MDRAEEAFLAGPDEISMILCVLILNERGERIGVKYTPSALKRHASMFGSLDAQKSFESTIVERALKQGARTGQVEVVMVKEYVCFYKNVSDVHLVVVGDLMENDLIVLEVIDSLYKALAIATGNRVVSEFLYKKIDSVLLILDELIEGSMICELNPNALVNRASMGSTAGDGADPTQSINDAISAARDGILKSIFQAASA